MCGLLSGRNIYRAVFKSQKAERNELFAAGRMAYCVELEDDYTETDIPTTTIRSKADIQNKEASTTLTTNDIVINKLTQILSYLRQGKRDKKKKLKEKGTQCTSSQMSSCISLTYNVWSFSQFVDDLHLKVTFVHPKKRKI